ncbi:hypothetical protein BZA05DRAFT_471441, partial [Tricharina praecox]|uniref:uncharacterized protein n=1 Tax=Tricharina praecox TaxID=43433 RepID=UPI00221FDC21
MGLVFEPMNEAKGGIFPPWSLQMLHQPPAVRRGIFGEAPAVLFPPIEKLSNSGSLVSGKISHHAPRGLAVRVAVANRCPVLGCFRNGMSYTKHTTLQRHIFTHHADPKDPEVKKNCRMQWSIHVAGTPRGPEIEKLFGPWPCCSVLRPNMEFDSTSTTRPQKRESAESRSLKDITEQGTKFDYNPLIQLRLVELC